MSLLTIIIIALIVIVAVAMIGWLKAREDDKTDDLYSDALTAIIKGNNSEAIKLLRQVVSKDSDNIGAYLQLGNLVRSVNPKQSAKIHQSLTVRPKLSKLTSKEIHQALALDYAEIEDYKRAKIEADMILKYDKNNLWTYQFLLQIAEKQRDWESAKTYALKIQKLSGNKDNKQIAEILHQTGLDYLEEGENKKARDSFEKAIKLNTNKSASYLCIGNIYSEDNNLKKAISNWENYLITSDKTDSEVYKKIETALFDLGRFSEVEQLYSRILAKKPSDKNTIIKLVNLFIDKNENEAAIELVEKAIRINDTLPTRLIKIKLLLDKANPIDLKDQIDDIVRKLDD